MDAGSVVLTAVSALVGIVVGAAGAWLVSRHYYRRATDDLWARLNRDQAGGITGRAVGKASAGAVKPAATPETRVGRATEDPTGRPPSNPPTP